MRRLLVAASVLISFCSSCFAQSNTDVYKVTSPIHSLTNQLGKIETDPNKSDKSVTLDPDKIGSILDSLNADPRKPLADPTLPTIIHILRWKDASHQTIASQKWYFFDPSEPNWRFYKGGFYLETKQGFFQRAAIPGYTVLQFVFIHLNADLGQKGGINEWASVPIAAAKATATLVARSVGSISLKSGGTGYTVAPVCALSGGGGTGATCSATLTGGSVTAVAVDSDGTGYTSPPNVVFAGGAPTTPAQATALLPLSTTVTGIQINSGGSGYTTAPTCDLSALSGDKGAGATCTAVITGGAVTSATVNSSGSGYTSPPTVVFGNSLKHPVSYTITVTKAQTQLIQDISTALQVLGLPDFVSKGEAPESIGYFGVSTFKSQWTTSGITIAASLDSSKPQTSGQPTGDGANAPAQTPSGQAASNSLSSNTYTNEKPSYLGLSAGVQITSYKDTTFQSTSGTLVPSTITSQNVYFFADAYYPGVLPSLTSFRYIPHPFWGLPIKGKVLRHQMAGISVGLHWLEPFGGVVFDTEKNQVKGPGVNKTGITYQYVFGLKVSMSAVGKALIKTK